MPNRNDNRHCPECGGTLARGARRCACGWQPAGGDHTPGGPAQCVFVHAGRRCPFPGLTGDANKGSRQAYYCHYHSDVICRGSDSEQDEFFSIYCKDEQTIRDTLDLWYGRQSWRETALIRELAAHPERKRRQDESQGDYQRRMIATCKRLAKGAYTHVNQTQEVA